MQEPVCSEHYPITTVIVANLVSLLIYVIGAYLLFLIALPLAAAYVIFIGILEVRLLAGHCVDCYYYGKTCAFGKGRLSALLFRKGSPERFGRMQLTWRDIVPDFLVFLIPVLAGTALLVYDFSAFLLLLVIILLLLGFAGNALVRRRLACCSCRQREIGCPAEKLFDKSKKA